MTKSLTPRARLVLAELRRRENEGPNLPVAYHVPCTIHALIELVDAALVEHTAAHSPRGHRILRSTSRGRRSHELALAAGLVD